MTVTEQSGGVGLVGDCQLHSSRFKRHHGWVFDEGRVSVGRALMNDDFDLEASAADEALIAKIRAADVSEHLCNELERLLVELRPEY